MVWHGQSDSCRRMFGDWIWRTGVRLCRGGFASRQAPRRGRAERDAKALGASAVVDRTARKKQIADGLRDIEKKGKQRTNLATRIEQAGLSITKQQYLVGSVLLGVFLSVATYIESKSLLLDGSGWRDRRNRAAATRHWPVFAFAESTSSSPTFRPRSTSLCAGSRPACRLATRSE